MRAGVNAWNLNDYVNFPDAAAGGADDYAKGACGVKYSYTVELRDTGLHGFVAPTSYIIPAGEETFAGLKAFATELVHYEHL